MSKFPFLIILPAALVFAVVWWDVIPAMRGPRTGDVFQLVLSIISGVLWLAVFWWAVHHFVFQLAALCPQRLSDAMRGTWSSLWQGRSTSWEPTIERETTATIAPSVRFAVFYLTCDDFIADCCRSCVEQDYPQDAFQVTVCDDSRSDEQQRQVAQFCEDNPRMLHVRRADRVGHKAGNLNHAFAQVADGRCDWVVIVDADQILPTSFLGDLARFVASQPPEIAFVQAGRDPLPMSAQRMESPLRTTPFQSALQVEMRLFFEREMYWRRQFGFLPFLGHGGAIRASAWKNLKGFPLVVSEDYAFAMVARENGWWGERIDQVRSWEAYPKDFGAFVVRLSKFARGAAELFHKHYFRFVVGRASITEKWDAAMLLATYLFMPVIFINIPLSVFLCSRLWAKNVSVLTPRLSYLFLGMFLLAFPILVSVNPLTTHAVRHWFWAFAVYTSALPVAAFNFVVYPFKKPTFDRTPKVGQPSPRLFASSILLFIIGCLELALAWLCWSPMSLLLIAIAIAHASFPLYRWLHEETSRRGVISRKLVYVPGCFFIAGVYAMWSWATN